MSEHALESLTQRQRECLRLVARDRSAKEIGAMLGISPETVNVHLKAAMAKLGENSRFAAARVLNEYEAANPQQGNPSPVMVAGDEAAQIGPPKQTDGAERNDELREERAIFDLEESFPSAFRTGYQSRGKSHDLTAFHRLALSAAIMVLIALAIIAAVPMSDAFQHLANTLSPLTN